MKANDAHYQNGCFVFRREHGRTLINISSYWDSSSREDLYQLRNPLGYSIIPPLDSSDDNDGTHYYPRRDGGTKCP